MVVNPAKGCVDWFGFGALDEKKVDTNADTNLYGIGWYCVARKEKKMFWMV